MTLIMGCLVNGKKAGKERGLAVLGGKKCGKIKGKG